VILKKVSFHIFRTFLVSKEEKKFYYRKQRQRAISEHDIWSLSKSSKSDIQKAISAKQIMIWKMFLRKNKHYVVIVLLPYSYLFARSSSFFLHFFFSFMENLFKKHPIISCKDKPRLSVFEGTTQIFAFSSSNQGKKICPRLRLCLLPGCAQAGFNCL